MRERTVGRALLAALVVTAACVVAWEPCVRTSLVLRREMYRLCERVGIMSSNGALGGQVAGFNYQRNPAWVHPVAASVSQWIATLPLVVLALIVFQRAALGKFGAGETVCGACGRRFGARPEESGVPVCACGNDLRAPSAAKGSGGLAAGFLSARAGPARAIVVRRTAIAVVVPLVAFGLMEVLDVRWRVVYWLIDLGKAYGGQVTQLGGPILWSADGPFSGDGRTDRVFNALVRHGPVAMQCVVVVVLAMAAVFVLARLESPLRPPHVARTRLGRVLGYRGPTVCGGCRSVLAGIRERKCAECGRGF